LTNFSKNSSYLRPRPLRLGEFLTNYWDMKKLSAFLRTIIRTFSG
jgi:hypothetical protein